MSTDTAAGRAPRSFHVLVKPIGPVCNMACRYCYYLEKRALYGEAHDYRMADDVLESFVRQYIAAQEVDEVEFGWQGGEPTLLGIDFFRRVVELQRKYADGKRVHNSLQTNGTLLNDEWAAFLKENDFLVGLSVDGPSDLHDYYRVDRAGNPAFDKVMAGLEALRKRDVEFNTLTCVNRLTSEHPLKVYRFLKQIGARHMQFIPLVERKADAQAREIGLELDVPPPVGEWEDGESPVTSWSVRPQAYGKFLTAIFDEWVRHDVGRFFVNVFDSSLANWAGFPGGVCVFRKTCGKALVLEHNGDLYSCDHYVYPEYLLGNITERSMVEMVESPRQKAFGDAKYEALPEQCLRCPWRFACNGECPKQRFLHAADGEAGLCYLCEGLQAFFAHIDPYMQEMTRLIQTNRPASEIMDVIAQRERGASAWRDVGRNDACPCGSGRKFKKCCGRSASQP
ncbi:anaerobic sulfatase maturase [Kiritimatiella glycovorans]|uniref:Anaerobic sulfatase-maturating enzyme n=1 Tax=Kiritimatiella glycovorans TaxID=1307763 RepID=A0A0G3EGF5_9BACT|nr:anaerobic sulfatase maturase [Kiritimatiella glycovorans]AKJ64492.1 Anaerobic sulfatase-maturating enzyme [Kiritimatiella glycovorans]